MVSIKLEISHDDERIYFTNKEFGYLGYTNYVKELFDKIKKVNWYVKKQEKPNEKCYIYTGSTELWNYKKLHQIVMIQWYGYEELEEAYKNDFIVEHHDNEEWNCLIENLSFAHNDDNLTKAHSYDKDKIAALPRLGMNFFKDFQTQKYQLTIGFTEEYLLYKNGVPKSLVALNLLYPDDFKLLLLDATNLLYNLISKKKMDLSKLQFIDYSYRESEFINLKDGESHSQIDIDGKSYLVLDERIKLVSMSPDKNLYKNNND